MVLVSDFDFHLPDELIARQPLADRAAARMLHLERSRDLLEDRSFREFPELLRPDDLLVFNNTKVLPARLFGHRSGARAQKVAEQNPAAKEFLRGKVEVLLTKQTVGGADDLGGAGASRPEAGSRRADLLRRRGQRALA